jgi:hypothetical protein
MVSEHRVGDMRGLQLDDHKLSVTVCRGWYAGTVRRQAEDTVPGSPAGRLDPGTFLIGSGRRPSEVAPAAPASTFLSEVAGVITFTVLSVHEADRRPRISREVSRLVSAAWPALMPVLAFRPVCPMPWSAA